MRSKISVIGAGRVGSAVVRDVASLDYADVVLVDRNATLAAEVTEDVDGAGALLGYEPRTLGTASWEHIAGSRIVVVAAGEEVAREAAGQIAERAPDAIVLVAAPPVPEVCRLVVTATTFTRGRVIGVAELVAAGRDSAWAAREQGVSVRDMVRPPHGGTDDSLPAFTAAAAVTVLVEAICRDLKRVVPCALVQPDGGFAEVRARIGAEGVERILEEKGADGAA